MTPFIFGRILRADDGGSTWWHNGFPLPRINYTGGTIPCDSAYAQGPFQGLDWREIKSWCPIEWEILGKTFLVRVIVLHEPWDIWMKVAQVCIGTQARDLVWD